MAAIGQGTLFVDARSEGRMARLWRVAGAFAVASVIFQVIRHVQIVPGGRSTPAYRAADSDGKSRTPGECEEAVATRFVEFVKQAGWTESVEGRLDQMLKDSDCAPSPHLFDALRRHALLLAQEEAALPDDRAEDRARLFYAASVLFGASASGSPDRLCIAAQARLAVADIFARRGLSEELRTRFAGEAISLFTDSLRLLPDSRSSLAIEIRGRRADACRDHGLPVPDSSEDSKDES
jgi:hypothetical protein